MASLVDAAVRAPKASTLMKVASCVMQAALASTRSTDEQRRRRERANAEKKASALRTQAAKMGAKATKAVAAQNMLRRAERMMAERMGAETVEVPSSHVAMVSHPDEVVELVEAAARSVAGAPA